MILAKRIVIRLPTTASHQDISKLCSVRYVLALQVLLWHYDYLQVLKSKGRNYSPSLTSRGTGLVSCLPPYRVNSRRLCIDHTILYRVL